MLKTLIKQRLILAKIQSAGGAEKLFHFLGGRMCLARPSPVQTWVGNSSLRKWDLLTQAWNFPGKPAGLSS